MIKFWATTSVTKALQRANPLNKKWSSLHPSNLIFHFSDIWPFSSYSSTYSSRGTVVPSLTLSTISLQKFNNMQMTERRSANMGVLPLHRLNNISGLSARSSIWGMYKTQPKFFHILKAQAPHFFQILLLQFRK